MNYLRNILLWLDEGANVIIIPILSFVFQLPPAAGNAHYTVSQFCAEMRERKTKFGCVACQLLTKMFKPFNPDVKDYDHCTSAMKGVPENIDAG